LKDYGLITSPAFILMKAADPRPATVAAMPPKAWRDRAGRWSRSEFGRKVAVDFEADANFDQSWGRPSHCRFPPIEQ